MMGFNFDDSGVEKKLPDGLKDYFFKHCDITQKELDQLIIIAKELPIDVLMNRLKVIADYFYRLKNENKNRGIYNEFAYAKKIILSDSFFENQKIDHTIPNVEETKIYLDELKKRRYENPGVDKKTFHKKVEVIKNLYDSNFKQAKGEKTSEKYKNEINRKIASIMKKLEDENYIKELENEIIKVYKTIPLCELEYRLFKTALLNIYLYYNEKTFQKVLNNIKNKKKISIKELSEIRQSILNQAKEENSNDF